MAFNKKLIMGELMMFSEGNLQVELTVVPAVRVK